MNAVTHNKDVWQVGKVKLSGGPRQLNLRDLTDPSVIDAVWADASKSTRGRRARRGRTRRTSAKTA